MKHCIIFVVVFAIVIASVHSFPKGSKGGGGGIKSGIKSVFKGSSKSSSKSSSSSSSSGSSFFATTTTPPASKYTTTTTRKSTTTTAGPISDQEFYEKIRSTYCNSGSKISLEEIEAVVTCPVNGFAFQLFSTLTSSSINSSTPGDNSTTTATNDTTTTTPSSTTDASVNTTALSTRTTPLTNESSPLEMTCQSFNSTCFEKMHTFVNECLTTGSNNSPLAEAYQFDLHLREEACLRNKTTIIDDWTNGTDKCLSPYFIKDGNVLRRAVAECKRRHPSSEVKLSHGYSAKILACVKDRIQAPSCICLWGRDNPTAMLMRNYYVESVVSLLLFVERQ